MKSRDIVERSLTLKRVQKLIICRGYTCAESSSWCGALSYQVGRTILARCAPASSDVHDAESQHAPGRDAHGHARPYYTRRGEKHVRGQPRGRSPQLWDSERVADFGGTWCDRLLLGDHLNPFRTALFLPRVPAEMEGDAVSRVARALRHIRASDVLLVTATPALPLGVVRLRQGSLPPDLSTPTREHAATSALFPPLATSLSLFGGTTTAEANAGTNAPFCLWIGVDDEVSYHGLCSPLVGAGAERAKALIVPLASFASALWVANPSACATYLETATATPSTLSSETANKRLWRTMQAAMLSTRDASLLEAHFTGTSLDARLSAQQQCYLAETLLRRLDEADQSHVP